MRAGLRQAGAPGAVAALALGLWLALASSSLAAPPAHAPLESEAIAGLDHACGAAVDAKGDVYAASAGEDEIRVFDPGHTEIATIPNANEPCGLAVDTKGTLYVSERGTGNVVKYAPDAYPLGGSPTYSAPAMVDGSGEARGIAVDPSDDRLYVASGDHVTAYQRDGTTGQDEIQSMRVDDEVTGGTFTLSFEGQTTAPIAVSAAESKPTPAEVQTALAALPNVGAGNVSVEEGNHGNRSYFITYEHALGSTDVPPPTPDPTNLIGGSPPFQIAFAGFHVEGFAFDGEIGAGQFGSADAVAAYTYDAGGEGRRSLSVADSDSDEIAILSGKRIDAMAPAGTVDGTAVPDTPECPACSTGFEFGGSEALAADWENGHLVVYDDGHAVGDEFEADGRYLDQLSSPAFADAQPNAIAVLPERSAVQRIAISSESSGSFKLGYEGAWTGPIAVGAGASTVQTALEGLSGIGAGNVSVAVRENAYFVSFSGALANRDVSNVAVDSSGISGSGFVATATRLPGYGPGRVYVSAGSGAGAKLLAFGSLAAPKRTLEESLSQVLEGAAAVAVDSHGDVYVAAGPAVHVFDPAGNEILKEVKHEGSSEIRVPLIEDANKPIDLAVDSAGRVYVLDPSENGILTYYSPSAYPPVTGTPYTRHEPPLVKPADLGATNNFPTGIGINPADDHLFVTSGFHTVEVGTPGEGSPVKAFAPSLSFGAGVDVDGSSGHVYISSNPGLISVIDPGDPGTTGDESVVARIDGAGSPRFALPSNPAIAIEQASGHLLAFDSNAAGGVQEFEASGGFVAMHGAFTGVPRPSRVAVDNSGGPNQGTVYLAFDDTAPGSFDLTAFGPLEYGVPATAVTGTASGVGGGAATLNGTVNPGGVELDACRFEYLTEDEYESNGDGFATAATVPCVPDPAGVGKVEVPVAVSAEVSGLDPQKRYRFRLSAANEYGSVPGEAGLFGPPLALTQQAQPVLYDEATLHASVDTSGLAGEYRFEYGSQPGLYDHSTPAQPLAADSGPSEVQATLLGLAEGTRYYFRAVATNEAASAPGAELSFETGRRQGAEECPNPEYRVGLSAALPDCRAYELVTPAETGGASPLAANTGTAGAGFSNWLTVPRGAAAGGRLSYFVDGATLPGFDGNGRLDGYRARRGAGAHPAAGWQSELFSPSYAEAGGDQPAQRSVAADQLYSFWVVEPRLSLEGTLPQGTYLRTPAGFEPLARGSVGSDPNGEGRFVSEGGTHVIFTSPAQLEPAAPPPGTTAIYDRAVGAATAQVLSMRPDGSSFGEGEAASYQGTSDDGTAVAFKVGGDLYLARAGGTVQVAGAPNAFAGISGDGERVFYANVANGGTPGDLFACDVAGGGCAGPEASQAAIAIAPDSLFVNVSADGSHAFFSSEAVLDEAEEGTAGARNLYAWDGAETRFIAPLSAADFENEAFGPFIDLGRWTEAVGPGGTRLSSPTRSTPDGRVLVFQSHARLGAYDNEGVGEIYRYEEAAAPAGRLLCLSCDPSGAVPGGADAMLEMLAGSPVHGTTLIPNLTDGGERAIFQSADRLLPEDANSSLDVYEWRAQGVGPCKLQGGCLSLISSGQGDSDSFLYAMSADGHDVFFHTKEKLVGADVAGSPSIYDARVQGGIPDPAPREGCQGDACQGAASAPPALAVPGQDTHGLGDAQAPPVRCPKGKRRVRRAGQVRCLGRHRKGHGHRRQRAGRERRAGR